MILVCVVLFEILLSCFYCINYVVVCIAG